MSETKDKQTAQAFSQSWNNLPRESVYSYEQFCDWFSPLTQEQIKNKEVLELGCGNASLMVHLLKWNPKWATGIDLGESVMSAKENLQSSKYENWTILQEDINNYKSDGYDLVYCIGVLHHMKEPKSGFLSVVKNVKPSGRFHCWVYAHEGNAVVRYLVDPLRKLTSRLPWWFTKYAVATLLVTPYFLYSKLIKLLNCKCFKPFLSWLPLYDYSLWIAQREFMFYRHVAFDQLVTPQTAYIKKEEIKEWLQSCSEIDQTSVYIEFRNGNSWKFGGVKK